MNNVIIKKTYSFEIAVSSGTTRNQVNFPTINLLDKKLTVGLETFIPTIITKAPSGNNLANNDLLKCTYINLTVSTAAGDIRQIWDMPILNLVNLNAQPFSGIGSLPFKQEFDKLQINWSKSYLNIADLTTLPVGTESFFFNVSYEDMP